MTAVDTFLATAKAKTEPERDHSGRYVIQGTSYTRMTTIADTLDDRYNLEKWKMRQVGRGVAKRPDLQALFLAHTPDEKRILDDAAEAAMDAAEAGAAANLGTSLHRMTERLDAGEALQVPEPYATDLHVYRSTLETAGVRVIPGMMELVVVNQALGYAGTFDRLVQAPWTTLGVVADLKTGANAVEHGAGAIAIQLAGYANATHVWDPETQTLSPMPPVDRTKAIIVHLPAGRHECDLWVIDLEVGFEALQHALWVRSYRSRAKGGELVTKLAAGTHAPGIASGGVPVDADERPFLAAGDPARRQYFRDRLRMDAEELMARHGVDLAAVMPTLQHFWPADIQPLSTDHAHTDDELDRIEAALVELEAHQVLTFREPYAGDIDPLDVLEGLPAGDVEGTTHPAPTYDAFVSVAPVVTDERSSADVELDAVFDVAPQDVVEQAIHRHEALPDDLKRQVHDACLAAGVPPLRFGQPTTAQMDLVFQELSGAELERQHRLAQLREAQTLLPDPEMTWIAVQMAAGLHHLDFTNPERQTVIGATALAMAVVEGELEMRAEEDGSVSLAATDDLVRQVVALHGGARPTLQAAKDAAGGLGVIPPRSQAALKSSPLLTLVLKANAESAQVLAAAASTPTSTPTQENTPA